MKLSVALCIYNGHKYLAEQLNSIIYQSVKVDEIVACDDRSTDRSADIIHSYQDQYPGLISYSLNSENMGAIRNFEQAIAQCTGDIIFLSDQDDIWKPRKVEKMLGRFHSDSRALLVFSNGDLIDDEGRSMNSSLWEGWHFDMECRRQWKNNHIAFLQLFANDNKATGATIAFRSSLKASALPITVPKKYWHDTWLALHAAACSGLRYIEESLIWYR
ncbi:MAG: glycosyltransferase family 2 protein, partial [Ktedonobacteraceae bacterium]